MNTGFLDPAVATVLTACGIETLLISLTVSAISPVATVLTACGIETIKIEILDQGFNVQVATVLTACGIETGLFFN